MAKSYKEIDKVDISDVSHTHESSIVTNERVYLSWGDNCRVPRYWSRALDEYIEELYTGNDEPLTVLGTFVAKTAGRGWRIALTPDSALSEDDAAEYEQIIRAMSQSGEGIRAALNAGFVDYGLSCNGAIWYVQGQSEQIEKPDNLRFGMTDGGMVDAHLAPLTDSDGRAVTLSSGLPVFGVGVQALDSRHCTRTGDYEFPIVYRSDNERIPLHRSRVISLVDTPSSRREHNGIGYAPAYRARQAAEAAAWDYAMRSEEIGDAPPRRFIVIKEGASAKEFKTQLLKAGQMYDNGNVEFNVPVFAPRSPGAKLDVDAVAFKSFPPGYNFTDQAVARMTTMTTAFYLTLADVGYASVARMSSRANAEAEKSAVESYGIPDIQQEFADQFTEKVLPDGLCFVWDNLTIEDEIQKNDARQRRQSVIGGYIDSGVISRITALEMLRADGDLTDEQFEREIGRIEAENAAANAEGGGNIDRNE